MQESEILKDFLRLVRLNVNPLNERQIADAVKEELAELGCTLEEDHSGEIIGGNTGNVFAVLEGNDPSIKCSLLFLAHMDRVPNTVSPKPRHDGNRIYTDGDILAADDVAGLVSIMDGIRRIQAEKVPHCRIEIVFTVSEELGLKGAAAFDKSKLQSKIGFAFDSPGRIGRITHAATSKAILTFEAFGKSAHAGNDPQNGISAVTAAVKVLARVKDGKLEGTGAANYSTFKADCHPVVINDYAFVKGVIFNGNHQALIDYLDELQRICNEVASETGATFKINNQVQYVAFEIDKNAVSINLAKKALARMGLKSWTESMGSGLDANIFNAAGIECIGLATGYSMNHSSEEYIEIGDLLLAGELAGNIIKLFTEEQKHHNP